MLLHFPLGLWFRRNFCFDINFAVPLHNPEAKLKVKCKLNFLFGVLLPCSIVKIYPQYNNKKAIDIKINVIKKERKYSVECTKAVTLLQSPGWAVFAQVSPSPVMAHEAQPSPASEAPQPRFNRHGKYSFSLGCIIRDEIKPWANKRAKFEPTAAPHG